MALVVRYSVEIHSNTKNLFHSPIDVASTLLEKVTPFLTFLSLCQYICHLSLYCFIRMVLSYILTSFFYNFAKGRPRENKCCHQRRLLFNRWESLLHLFFCQNYCLQLRENAENVLTVKRCCNYSKCRGSYGAPRDGKMDVDIFFNGI